MTRAKLFLAPFKEVITTWIVQGALQLYSQKKPPT